MHDVSIKKIEDMDYYRGEHSIPGIRFRPASRELGVTAWGMGVLEIEPGCTSYPEHDHAQDGQEEVYAVLRGSGTLIADDGEQAIEQGTLVRVGPGTKRRFVPGDEGLLLLAIGATPGQAYAPRS